MGPQLASLVIRSNIIGMGKHIKKKIIRVVAMDEFMILYKFNDLKYGFN